MRVETGGIEAGVILVARSIAEGLHQVDGPAFDGLGRLYVTRSEPCGSTVCPRSVDAGHAQIAAGYAWHDKEHLDEQPAEDRLRYARAEQDARTRHAGLWAEPVPMPPWRFRHLHPRRLSERTQFR